MWTEGFLICLTMSWDMKCYGHDPTVFTYCSSDFIKLRVLVNANYFGIVFAGDRESCSVRGTGERNLFMYIPLQEPGASSCGVVQDERGWATIVRVQAHSEVETTRDASFLIQCSLADVDLKRTHQHLPISMRLTQNGTPAKVAVVGARYVVQMLLPSGYGLMAYLTEYSYVITIILGAMHRIGSCLAFSGNRIEDMTPLLDYEGCAAGDMMTSFRQGSLNSYIADLTMFRFNGTHEFYIQCSTVQCFGKCPLPSCFTSRRGDDQDRVDADHSDLNFVVGGIVSKRILVSDSPPRIDYIKKPCIWSQDGSLIGLTVLLATLVLFTFATCASAIKNRPCRCHFDVRDSPPNEQRFSRLSEEAASVRYPSGIRPEPNSPHRPTERAADAKSVTPKSDVSAILAFGDPEKPKVQGRVQKLEMPTCCQTGKSMDELPQAPTPDSCTRNLDLLVETSLQKLKAMLPPPTDEDVSSSAYLRPKIKNTISYTSKSDQNLYETPSGCMLSTLF